MGSQPTYDDEASDHFEPGPNLGPDDRDRDLMDGSWEQEFYSGRIKTRNWNAIGAGIAVLVVAALVVPLIFAVFD